MWWLAAAEAMAWDTVGSTWPEMPVHYTVSDDPAVDEEALAAIEAAFATWDAVECADVSFAYDGRGATPFAVQDGRNGVSLVASGWPEEPTLVSLPTITTDGAELVEVDIALNTEHHAWVFEGADGRTRLDVQAGITHEIGHLLGLWHSTVADATLNPAMVGNPDARTLSDDDVEGICALYPAGGAAGGAVLGEACAETLDCEAPLQCVADAAEQYCAPPCGASDGCPAGYACLDAGAERVCGRETGCGCASDPRSAASLVGAVGLLLTLARRRTPR